MPLWLTWLSAKTWRQVWWTGWLTQFTLTALGFNWVAHTVHEFGNLPWFFAILCLLGYCCIANLYIPLAGVAWWFFSNRFRLSPLAQRLLLPAVIAIGEWQSPTIFDWNFGYPWLYAHFPAAQLADIVGIKGLSHLTFFANLLFLLAYEAKGAKRWRYAGSCVAGLAALNVAGHLWLKSWPPEDGHAKVAVIQANIGNLEKQYAEHGLGFRDEIINKYARMSREAVTGTAVDLLAWPETAFPDILRTGQVPTGYAAMVSQLVRDLKTTLVTGAYGMTPDGRATNSMFVFTPDGQIVPSHYDKTVLLAFGEYFPGAQYFPRLRKWFPEVGDFARGQGPMSIAAGPWRLGPQICYEGLFDWFTRRLADSGAQIIMNATNDSWYGDRQQPMEHVYITLARALEVRRPLVRTTNTGISTVISPRGEMGVFSPTHAEWSHVFDIPYYQVPPVTVFQKLGYIVEPLLMILWIVGVILGQQRIARVSKF